MKKVILFMVGVLASLMLSAQSRWSVTPEAGLVVNKENEGTSVTLGFKAGIDFDTILENYIKE